VVGGEREFRGKFPDFHLPVAEKARGHHDDALLFGELAFLFHFQEECDDLQRLAEAHVVGQNAAEADLQVLVHPGVATHLVGAECCVQPFR
jgi:hypothetical protein